MAMTWKEEVVAALEALGGKATYSDLYDYIKKTTSRQLKEHWTSSVRNAIEIHSSDSDIFQGKEDLFYSVSGRGSRPAVWGLRSMRPHLSLPTPASQVSRNNFDRYKRVDREQSREQQDKSNNSLEGVEQTQLKQKYSLTQCADDTNFKEADLERWLRAIERKRQVILYGSPGTGKTFIAEQLARYLAGDNDERWEVVQFHPAYSYEDFIQGIRPQSQDGQLKYPLVSGCFLKFCKKAESCEGLCVLIIDEINRANLAQVFGELMYLLEYRDKKIRLAGSNKLFGIPQNVRIIGTMNTADRSIALVDHALRRRFAFIEIRPNYNVLRHYHQKKKTAFKVDGLIETLTRLNNAIADKHYEVGISYFLTETLAEEIEDIWQMEIEPYLEEYFYDQLDKVDEFRWDNIKQQVCP
jgi:5-methylcytosine-specific restriction protein B